jgi:hypothetical protein
VNPAAAGTPDRSLTLDELRAELHRLTALADTAELPRPTVIHDQNHPWHGYEWLVNHPREVGRRGEFRRWSVRALEHDDVPNVVYLNTPGHMEDSPTAATTTEARQYAMAILAACNRADHQAAGIPRLEDRRKNRPTKGDHVT